MYINYFFIRLFRLLNVKKEWKYPKQVQILIYEESGSEYFSKYFTNYTYSILHTSAKK